MTIVLLILHIIFNIGETNTQFFVSTTGSDSNNGTTRVTPFATFHRAKTAVRSVLSSHVGPIDVLIAPGTYRFFSSFNLTPLDSGTSSENRVRWTADYDLALSSKTVAPVTISGGVPITGWKPSNMSGVWLADVKHISTVVGENFKFLRHLYINNRRAGRAIQPGSGKCQKTATSPCAKPKTIWGDLTWGTANNVSFQIVGVNATKEVLKWPEHGKGVEFVFTGVGGSPWAESRCVVDYVTEKHDGSLTIVMTQPCHSSWAHKCLVFKHQKKIAPPTTIENVGPAYITPGSGTWWLDVNNYQIIYAPLLGEDMAIANVIMPVVEQLILGAGTGVKLQDKGHPIAYLEFIGFSFQHATWFQPSGPIGYIEDQSGQDLYRNKTLGNIAFSHATSILFDRCEFTHLGAVGLSFDKGAHNNTVTNCYFHDISGAGFQVGSFTSAAIVDPSAQDIGNTINNSIVVNIALEFHGNVGILVGYTAETTISHNDVGNCTYGPISVGWGWGELSYARDNIIIANRAHDYKSLLNDGGCIYTLSSQPRNVITKNWCYRQGTPTSGALYPDEGSANMTWSENVVSDIGASSWAHIWTSSIHNLLFDDNYHDTSKIVDRGTNITIVHDHLVQTGQFPTAARAIMAASGPIDSPWLNYESTL